MCAWEEQHSISPRLTPLCSYTPDGQLLPPAKSVKASPSTCAERVTNIITASNSLTDHFKQRPFSVCLHSDMDGAVDNVKAVRAAIDALNQRTS